MLKKFEFQGYPVKKWSSRSERTRQTTGTHWGNRATLPTKLFPSRENTPTHNTVLSRHWLQQQPVITKVQTNLEGCDWQSFLKGKTPLPFYGLIELSGKIHSVNFQEDFVVSKINEDAIPGRLFLESHKCRMDVSKATLCLQGEKLACNFWVGRLVRAKNQVTREQSVPPELEQLMVVRKTTGN